MKVFVTGGILMVICAGASGAWAQLNIMPWDEPCCVFGGRTQSISLRCQNAGRVMIETNIRMRTMQLSSTTAATIAEAPWKTLRVLPRQTVVETTALAFPAVRSETRFLVQWLEDSNRVLAATEIRVYPTNLLRELRPLLAGGALGVFDPQNELKESLRNAGVEFVDLENAVLEHFRGEVAIIGPFNSKTESASITPDQIKTLAGNGVGVVWVRAAASPHASGAELRPSFYSVPENQTATVVVQPELVANLAGNPQAQLNLIHFCKLALNPHPLTLPSVNLQP